MFDADERAYLARSRVGRLATADSDGRPNVVPVCFAFVDDPDDGPTIVTPLDEKPKAGPPLALRRSRDIEENPYVSLVVDEYSETWSDLGWVQVRGQAGHLAPGDKPHGVAIEALRAKYDQYESHALEDYPIIRLSPGSVVSWGSLERH